MQWFYIRRRPMISLHAKQRGVGLGVSSGLIPYLCSRQGIKRQVIALKLVKLTDRNKYTRT